MWFNYKKALGYVGATGLFTAVCVATGAAVVTPAAVFATSVVVAGELAAAVGLYKGGKALFGFGKDFYEDRIDSDYRFKEEVESEDEYTSDEDEVDNKWKKDLVTSDGQYDEFHSYAVRQPKKFLGFTYGYTEQEGQVMVPEENRYAQEDLDACQRGQTRSGRAFRQHN